MKEQVKVSRAVRADSPEYDDLRDDETWEVRSDVAYKRVGIVNVVFYGRAGADGLGPAYGYRQDVRVPEGDVARWDLPGIQRRGGHFDPRIGQARSPDHRQMTDVHHQAPRNAEVIGQIVEDTEELLRIERKIGTELRTGGARHEVFKANPRFAHIRSAI